ncbi:hypothetical protein BDD12DRAFT_884293 [Trichophaea hybrida]|nr:hypothetical protein BDD12DRAFT_884293 [Trichophaea hybrida]
MPSPGRRDKKRKQRIRQRNQQQNPQGNEQRHLQGNGASSPAPKRDDNTSKSGNRATYNNSKHNEFTNSEIHGGASFTHNYNTLQQALPMDARMHGDLQKLVQTIDWHTLSSQLSVIDQDKHRSTISDFNLDEPENFWITKNLDFMQWESDNDLRTLLLSAPPGHGTTEVCSHFIDIAEGKDSQAGGPVFYFFCSSTPKAQCSTYLTHTLLYLVVHCSNTGKSNSIAAAFLSTLVHRHFQRHSPNFRESDPQETTIKMVLDAPDNELIEALAEALKKAGIRKSSIVVEGL